MPGRIRTIKPEWLDDQRIARASDGARIMSVALLLLADDYGNGRCDPDSIATRVWPTSLTSLEGIQKVARKSQESLCELTEIRFCGLYSVDGQSYFTIRNWEKHQKVNHPSKPLVPGPPSDFWEQSKETILSLSRDILRVSESLLPDHDHDHDHDHDLEMRNSPSPAPASPQWHDSKASRSGNGKVAQKKDPRISNPPSAHKEIVDAYFAAFEARRGEKPTFDGADGKAVGRLIEKLRGDVEKAKSVIANALSRDCFGSDTRTIREIASNPAKWITSSAENSGKSRTSCPDRIEFTERHRGLCKRMSREINLAWSGFASDCKSKGITLVDWSEGFSRYLVTAVERFDLDVSRRSNGHQASSRAPGATTGAPPTTETRPAANSEHRPGAVKAVLSGLDI